MRLMKRVVNLYNKKHHSLTIHKDDIYNFLIKYQQTHNIHRYDVYFKVFKLDNINFNVIIVFTVN